MRTLRTIYTQIGPITLRKDSEEYVDRKDVPSWLDDVLAQEGLTHITVFRQDGEHKRRINYTHWEYDCQVCGEYGHDEDACPATEELEDEQMEEFLSYQDLTPGEPLAVLEGPCTFCGSPNHNVHHEPTPGAIADAIEAGDPDLAEPYPGYRQEREGNWLALQEAPDTEADPTPPHGIPRP